MSVPAGRGEETEAETEAARMFSSTCLLVKSGKKLGFLSGAEERVEVEEVDGTEAGTDSRSLNSHSPGMVDLKLPRLLCQLKKPWTRMKKDVTRRTWRTSFASDIATA